MLTLAQQRTLNFIQTFVTNNGFAPTHAEIAQGTGIQSRGVAHRYLTALQQAGYIRLIPGRHRNIELCQPPSQSTSVRLPISGAIAAGVPLTVVSEQEPFCLDSLFEEGHFALRVKGDSMRDAGIFDGDVVICKSAERVKAGDVVVALIDQQDATLKRFHQHQNGMVTLLPDNDDFKPQQYPEEAVEIQGVFVGLVRLP